MTAPSSIINGAAPGVYTTENQGFGAAIVGVPTAVPVFIGYTQCAGDPDTGSSLYNTPVRLSTMAEFLRFFGGPAAASFSIVPTGNPDQSPSGSEGADGSSDSEEVTPHQTPSFQAGHTSMKDTTPQTTMTRFLLKANGTGVPNRFNLFWTIQAFFVNGGGDCFVVSAGSYWDGELPTSPTIPSAPVTGKIELDDDSGQNGLMAGLKAAGCVQGPTMIVIPEACQLGADDYGKLAQKMLQQASELQDRVALLDLPGCLSARTLADLQVGQVALANAIAPGIASASYGVAYAPALNTSIVSLSSILYTNIVPSTPDGDNSVINNILTTQAMSQYSNAALAAVRSAIATAFPIGDSTAADTSQYSMSIGPAETAYKFDIGATSLAQRQQTLNNYLLHALPVFEQILQLIATRMNVLPPSGFLAGVYAQNDNIRGVWNAPANLALASVVSPLYAMTDAEQGAFNIPLNGQAINITRVMVNRGNVVWGARTLDGNSLTYRYVQSRRTLIYIEQSIKRALQPYVFASNDETTWRTVTAVITSFLTGLWQQGGLMGGTPSEAFTVNCGLGSTMTVENIVDGYMIVAVNLQMSRPAEFTNLTFSQTMGS